ncbi:MAG: cell division protein ZapA [Prevotella sp.]
MNGETGKKKQQISLHVRDMDIRVFVEREQEPLYRDAAKLINDTVNAYSAVYNGRKSEKELLYMVMIDIALKFEIEASRNDTEPFRNILGTLTSEIEDALK